MGEGLETLIVGSIFSRALLASERDLSSHGDICVCVCVCQRKF